MRDGKVLDLGDSFKGDFPCNDSLICPVRFFVSIFYNKKKKFKNQKTQLPQSYTFAGDCCFLRRGAQNTDVDGKENSFDFFTLLLTNSELFGKLLCLSHALHLEDGNYIIIKPRGLL